MAALRGILGDVAAVAIGTFTMAMVGGVSDRAGPWWICLLAYALVTLLMFGVLKTGWLVFRWLVRQAMRETETR